jgi:hypothetical protein
MIAPEGETTPETGRNCWRIARAARAAVIVDAADYFRLVRQAMVAAETQILLIGWDFDTRIDLLPKGADDAGPTELGAFLSWLPNQRPGPADLHPQVGPSGRSSCSGAGPPRCGWRDGRRGARSTSGSTARTPRAPAITRRSW